MMPEHILAMYATAKTDKLLPPLSPADRTWCFEQIGSEVPPPKKCGDKMLCAMVLHHWAEQAASLRTIRYEVEDNYWNGEPETLCDPSPLWLRFWRWLIR
jgi:hypothetical protein